MTPREALRPPPIPREARRRTDMHFQFERANVIRAALMVVGVALGYVVHRGWLPSDLATQLNVAAGVLFGTGAVQLTKASS